MRDITFGQANNRKKVVIYIPTNKHEELQKTEKLYIPPNKQENIYRILILTLYKKYSNT